MSNSIILNFDKPVQVFTINGKDFNVYYDDESLKKYEDAFKNFAKEYDRLTPKKFEKLNDAAKDELLGEQTKLIAKITEVIFGENSYEEIYELVGKSVFNIYEVIQAFRQWFDDKLKSFQEEKEKKLDYYTSKK